jgi:hypothetical protein
MRMIRFTRLKSLGDDSPFNLIPESLMKVNAPAEGAWNYAHIRTPYDESDDDIHNDEIHGVKDEAAQE